MLVIGECLFSNADIRQPVADAARKTRSDSAACLPDQTGPSTPLQTASANLRANQERLGFFFAGFDEAKPQGVVGRGREEVFFRPQSH